jgi:hypothetical protein
MAKKTETFVLKLTSAIVMDGEIITKDNLVEVTEREAKNLLARGKAVLADDKESKAATADLNDMTVDALRKIADDAGVEGYRDMKKAELIQAIEAATEAAE